MPSKLPLTTRPLELSRRAALRLLAAALGACDDFEGPDRRQVLRDVVSVVMLPTYADLATGTGVLSDALRALNEAPSVEALAGAQGAWRAARAHWKSSEAFFFGPVEDLGSTRGAIDSWPVDGARLDALVAGTDPVDLSAVKRLGANLCGFPGLEHLLFDSLAGDAEVLSRLLDAGTGARRRELAASLGADLAETCQRVLDAWDPQKGAYATALAEAGKERTLFTTQRDALDKIITALLYLAELMVVAKFAKPLGVDMGGAPQLHLEEAPRSDSSLDDLVNNLRGMESVYLCRRAGRQGISLSDSVRSINAGADARFREALASALAAVGAIPPPLRVALGGDAGPVRAAYEAVRVVKRLIATDIAGSLGASIGFGYSDTD
jgi:uncharacterized protein